MPQYLLAVAVSSGVAVGLSLLDLYLSRPTKGKIQLPVEEENLDPFNVTQPIDLVDGFPIDEQAFWTRLRNRKLVLVAVLSVSLVLSIGILVQSVLEGLAIPSHSILLLSSVYIFVLAIRSTRQHSMRAHTESMTHLSALLAFATLLFITSALLPAKDPLIHVFDTSNSRQLPLWYAITGLDFMGWLLAVTTPLGPPLHYPAEAIYGQKTIQPTTNPDQKNVSSVTSASWWDCILFSYSTKVILLGNKVEALEIGDLPIIPLGFRSAFSYLNMKRAMETITFKVGSWRPLPGSGWTLGYRLVCINKPGLVMQFMWASSCAVLDYAPPFFLKKVISYLEADPLRKDRSWGFFFVAALFTTALMTQIISVHLWSLSVNGMHLRLKSQLSSILFAKTLVRKDVAFGSVSTETPIAVEDTEEGHTSDFSTRAHIMTLMTADVDTFCEFPYHLFSLIDSPIEILVGSIFLYQLLGVSCFFGLAVSCLLLPLNHFASKIVALSQANLMKARDERITLMNEILGAIRMLKFMAWERSFEARVLKVRDKELQYQRKNYTIEILFNTIWDASPVLVTLVSFWHFTVIRAEHLTPSIAFTTIIVFAELKFALNALPETLINMLQSLVSMRRIEQYLSSREVAPVPPIQNQSKQIAFQSCTITWPRERPSSSKTPSAASTPRRKFVLTDLTLQFPLGELSLVCGKLGSGKSLLLLALLGEADVLSGQVVCSRSPPDALASFATIGDDEEWIVEGMCAYVPQTAWLRNASIKDNILFNLPYNSERYKKTLAVCGLVGDVEGLADGDNSEIGERGVNMSGGQKAKISLARAVYSRASILFLDDVLSAVDSHTAHHLYHECLKGELVKNRTVILVSHHVRLCAPGASYVVALEQGGVLFSGTSKTFERSGIMRRFVQSTLLDPQDIAAHLASMLEHEQATPMYDSSFNFPPPLVRSNSKLESEREPPRRFVEEEKRAVGRIRRGVWATYFSRAGNPWYWRSFCLVFGLAAIMPVVENGWLETWSNSALEDNTSKSSLYYIGIYAAVNIAGLSLNTIQWFILYAGSIRASIGLHKGLLETVLLAPIRFHDSISRGRLLNRFGKDFDIIDSSLADNFGRSVTNGLAAITTLVTVSVVGGWEFLVAVIILLILYYKVAMVYGQIARDIRRLDAVTRSPVYSIYEEIISGQTLLRAFGAGSYFLRDMMRRVDINQNPMYWFWGVNRWLSVRFNILSAVVVAATALAAVLNPRIDAALAGFALTFANSISAELMALVRRFIALEQSMVAVERVKEYSDIEKEAPEYTELRPPENWPSHGAISFSNFSVRYAPDLPDVLHDLNFDIRSGEKVGLLGKTGSGKSTLVLSMFRFLEATHGSISIDGLDISTIGTFDVRSAITIIPQDPTILSGTLRSTLDILEECSDTELYEALRRVHLLTSGYDDEPQTPHMDAFRDLDGPVSTEGDNFSAGEKQLLCMARAILKRSKILVMDEATANVDYITDELISRTIRQEFSNRTILTIAHRIRTVIDYDRIMIIDKGRVVEFDRPGKLLQDRHSKFYALCKATGKEEFTTLKKLAGL
ncbi:multidrug resistance-associated ABC transporter [Mycena floridula]|nr:multidrug resistance-associated ABC transporter [Mycena floridula]